MKITVKENLAVTLIIVNGRALVNEMSKLQQVLLNYLDCSSLELDISGITHCDFSFYQLMVAFLKDFTGHKDRSISIIDDPQGDFLKTWNIYGFDPSLIEDVLSRKESHNG